MDNKSVNKAVIKQSNDYDRTSFDPDLTLNQFMLFRDYIHEHSGIFIDETKLDSLRISLFARATFKKFMGYEEYYNFLTKSQEEFNELLNLITINETSFFRFNAQFEVLNHIVLPEIIAKKKKSNKSLRIWSAGCSTGEEPYSIGMCVLESLPDIDDWNVQIYGTDVSKRALDHAEEGFYNEKTVRSMDKYFLNKYFKKANDIYRAKDSLRSIVSFGYQNLIKEPYPIAVNSNWDIVFCRNVTIYFRIESTIRVISNFYQSLNPGGYLFIGHSETLANINSRFKLIEGKNIYYYQKEEDSKIKNFEKSSLPDFNSKINDFQKKETVNEDKNDTEIENLLKQSNEYFKNKNFEMAISLLNKLLSKDPDNTQAYLTCAFILANQNKLKEAMLECQAALQVNPFLPAAHYLLGVIHSKQGETESAIEEYKKTIYIDSNYALAHLNLANIYFSQKKFNKAEKEFSRTIESINDNPEGDWKEFLGGFLTDLIIESCRNNIAELKKT